MTRAWRSRSKVILRSVNRRPGPMTPPTWLDAQRRPVRRSPAGPVAARSRRCGFARVTSGRTAGRRHRRSKSRTGAAAPRSTCRCRPEMAGGRWCRSGTLTRPEPAATVGAASAAMGGRSMILRLTSSTAALVGETAAEWELLEKQGSRGALDHRRAGRRGPAADARRGASGAGAGERWNRNGGLTG
jgi:hypothetical protein